MSTDSEVQLARLAVRPATPTSSTYQRQCCTFFVLERMRASEVLIIGAGPYGLSISTHLRGRGIDHLIVGRPMDSWRTHMPAGMYLKSEPYGSDMSCPQAGFDLEGYSRSERIEGIERGTPLPVERFLDYADWYIKQLVPGVSDVTATEIKAVNGGFRVAFADAEPVAARRVVIATGVLPHFYIPAELSCLPPELVSHTIDHRHFDQFRGRRVAIVGGGSSALETAALVHEAGGEAQLVVRCPDSPVWGTQGRTPDPTGAAPEQQALRRVEVPALEFSDRLPSVAGRHAGREEREPCWGLWGLGG